MKTKNFKALLPVILPALMLASSIKNCNAQNFQTVYMDSISLEDTVYNCISYDHITFIPSSHPASFFFWTVFEKAYPDDIYDTIFSDTIGVGNYFEGQVSYQGYDGLNAFGTAVDIKPLTLYAPDLSGTAGKLVQLNARTNYSGDGISHYSWSPVSGLSNPNISNPTVAVSKDMEYTVTVNVPNGCIISKTVNVTIEPVIGPSICIVGVDSLNRNVIYWEGPVLPEIDSVFIFKETNITNEYIKIGGVAGHEKSFFTDEASFPMIQSNKYKISCKDTCGIESDKSPAHKSIHLAINQGLNNSWNLIWEHYEGFPVQTYFIYRGTDPKDLQLIGSTAGTGNQFTDFGAPSGSLYYQIEVRNPEGCNISGLKSTQAFINSSRSNIASTGISGLDEPRNQSDLYSVYPNPFGDKLFFELRKKGFINGTIEINDLQGRRIKTMDIKSAKSEINCSGLKKGLYILKITVDKEIFIQKIIRN